jgi:hypothetical protein
MSLKRNLKVALYDPSRFLYKKLCVPLASDPFTSSPPMLNSLESFFLFLVRINPEDLFKLLLNVTLIYCVLLLTVVLPFSALYMWFFDGKGAAKNKSTQTELCQKRTIEKAADESWEEQ